MAAADVRDMLDLPAEGQPRQKKQKVVEKRPEGVTRELYALLGERAPPIAIDENRYKGRPKWISKSHVHAWRMEPFVNSARSDGLVLHHWQRQEEAAKRPPVSSEAEIDKNQKEVGISNPAEKEYSFAKYNVKAKVPRRYTDEEYSRHLKSDDWSRAETDYLMDIVEDYDLRWIVIADRYDFQPQPPGDAEADATALVPAKRYRSMEQMKARYYFVAASMLSLDRPPPEMSEAEFDVYEKMRRFDPERERARKELAALQLNRTADEVREEGILLEELKRITANEQNFITERRELYARLDVPVSVGNTAMYQSSQGLSQLLQTLLQADKSKKRRSLVGPEPGVPSSMAQTPPQPGFGTARESRADTPIGAQPASMTKKAAAAAAAAANKEALQPIRTLTPAEEEMYGVQHHDRLAPGVQFRSDKALKLTQAKSNIQSQKLAAALAELEIPPRLLMPTERVCKEFEKLIQSVNLLLDARKVSEKVESEIRVLEAAKAERERKAREAKEKEKAEVEREREPTTSGVNDILSTGRAEEASTDRPATKEDREELEASGNAAGTDADTSAGSDQQEVATSTHKRSASVLSNVSDNSTKRQRR